MKNMECNICKTSTNEEDILTCSDCGLCVCRECDDGDMSPPCDNDPSGAHTVN